MSAELINAEVLFATQDCAGGCCDCCWDYCPNWDADRDPIVDLFSFEIDGVPHISDRFLIIRADVVAGVSEGKATPMPEVPKFKEDLAAVPEVKPALSDAWQSAWNMDRLERVGLTVHGDSGNIRHLYLGDTHVGWTTVSTKHALEPSDLPTVRSIAKAVGLDITRAAKAFQMAHGEAKS